MAIKGSVASFAAKRPDHLLPESRRWPPRVRAGFAAKKDQITYFLRAVDGHPRVSAAVCFAPKRPDYLQTEGRRWPPKGQQQFLQQRDQITYSLRAIDGHKRVSSSFGSTKTRSLTH